MNTIKNLLTMLKTKLSSEPDLSSDPALSSEPDSPVIFVVDQTQEINRGKVFQFVDKSVLDNFLFHSVDSVNIVSLQQNALIECISLAFYKHHPLELSPDVIWMAICQGFSLHINQNAEILRDKIVKHQGQKDLILWLPNFSPHSRDIKDWERCVSGFTEKLSEELAQSRFHQELLNVKFSTTTQVESISQKIVWMDCMKRYFRYVGMCGCAMTEIHLKGNLRDWILIKKSIQKMRGFEIDWWIDVLDDVLDNFISAFQGRPDINFWKSTARKYGMSGQDEPFTGWINTFFPYIKDGSNGNGYVQFKELMHWKTKEVKIYYFSFPSGQNEVPIIINDLSDRSTHKFLGVSGFFGVEQDPNTGAVRTKIGWGLKKNLKKDSDDK